MKRKGISLLEVMFAIGVAAVGLLGVVAVLPLGLYQVGRGNQADRSSRAGLNGLEEFKVRAMGDPNTWRVWYNGAFVPASQVPDLGKGPFNQYSFAIDPRFLAMPANKNIHGTVFPYTLPGNTLLYRMPRISLQGFLNPYSPEMIAAQADDVFVIPDELVFSLPDDKTYPPIQTYTMSPGPDGQWGVANKDDDGNGTIDDIGEAGWPGSDDIPFRRQHEGQYSWMAMLMPRRDQRLPTTFPDANSDLYTLAIIVFHNRDPLLEMNDTNERVAQIQVADFHAGGLNGGDVTITPIANSANPAVDLEFKRGDWLLLAGKLASIPANPPNGPTIFQWYHVDETEQEPYYNVQASRWERDATLFGPDWPVAEVGDTEVIILSNVVGVYQKNIRMEFSSLWSG